MENKKLTNSMVLGLMMEVLRGQVQVSEIENIEEVFDKVAKLKEQTDRKNHSGKDSKPTKAQLENEVIKQSLLDFLSTQKEPVQIKDILKVKDFSELSSQKVSALFKQLVENGKVEKIIEKRISKFQIVVDKSEEI